MKYYIVVLQNLSEDLTWLPEYLVNVRELVEKKYGGRYLARTDKIDHVEGEGAQPNTLTIIEFPSKEAVEGFYNDPDYAPLRENRKAGSINSDLYIIAGEDMAANFQ